MLAYSLLHAAKLSSKARTKCHFVCKTQRFELGIIGHLLKLCLKSEILIFPKSNTRNKVPLSYFLTNHAFLATLASILFIFLDSHYL